MSYYISSTIHKNITEGKENLEIRYDSDIPWFEDEYELLETYHAIMKKNRTQDLFRGTRTRGPHKDDLQVLVNDLDIRHYGSQGQQRTAALSLKLAEIRLIGQPCHRPRAAHRQHGWLGIARFDDHRRTRGQRNHHPIRLRASA